MIKQQNTFMVTRYGRLQFIRTYAPVLRRKLKEAVIETGHMAADFITEFDKARGLG